ncbi:MAG TPA: class I SAM-dependent methyltransferase [Brevundimonas sp.]|jgi:SAM-dependent methyltransferase|uniref:class I SAM-dependent methyltransferase n=1 Tax=Brevundimonas sp. TaxID=1871086 RepID=UPI002DE70272|nr:class I SAM-dependent methyltransferase [Brevundimonas sp.]
MFDRLQDDAGIDVALENLLKALGDGGYRFVTPTPATHRLVAARRSEAAPGDLRDVFGWRRPFREADLDANLWRLLAQAGALEAVDEGRVRSRVRVSSLDDRLYLHSASGSGPDEVFLGPDSYRFARLLRTAAKDVPRRGRFMDVGTGAGVGALTLAGMHPGAEVVAGDVNPGALRLVRINARAAGLRVQAALGPGLTAVQGDFDLIVANPPYIAGSGGRTYRDGGDDLGTRLALEWMREAVDRLRPGGRIVLYTGSPIVDGRDSVQDAMAELAGRIGGTLAYEELDPDVFGGTLKREAYAEVERIAAIGAVLQAPS